MITMESDRRRRRRHPAVVARSALCVAPLIIWGALQLGHSAPTTLPPVPTITVSPGQSMPACGFIVYHPEINSEQDTGRC